MLELKRLDRDPPGGWKYECWDEFQIKKGGFTALVAAVKQHYRVNDKEYPENLEEIIMDQICLRVPASICKGDGPPRYWPSATQVVSGTKVIVDLFKRGGEAIVDQQEADRRANICMLCEYNTRLEGCLACSTAYKLVARIFGGLSTRHDNRLHVCRVCGCLNKAQIHCSKETLIKATPTKVADKYPDAKKCWKRELLEGAQNDDTE